LKIIIEKLGHLGDGIAMGADGPIYASGCLPGEEVEGELVGDTLTGVRIITPSAKRVRAPCSHAKTCGGCHFQHAADDLVAEWKQGVVEGALTGQGLSTTFLPIITSAAQSRRRATFTGRKLKGGAQVGFHARGSDMLVSIPNCKLLHPDLLAMVPVLEDMVKLGASRTVEVQLAVTRSVSGADISVMGGKALDSELRMELARLTESAGFARLTWNNETVALRTFPIQRFGNALVAPPPGSFLQATQEGESALLRAVALAIGPGAKRIADLFAGSGTFALPLAERFEVLAVEGEAKMAAALEKAARNTAGLRRVTVEARDLFRRPLEPAEFKGIDAVVIDPPRAGAEAQFATLAVAQVPIIASVSCNPITFARDAKTLIKAGYTLDWVQVVDQFRWSTHVELVGRFSISTK
jgi:23S rRNA (uracil1939-C5)-methyltransferase